MKTLFLLGFTATLFMLSATAQAQQTALTCRQNLTIIQTAVNAGDFERALGPWMEVWNACPEESINLYVFGSQIFQHLHSQETDAAKRQEHLEKVLLIYDRRMELFPDRQPRGVALFAKTYAYMNMAGDNANQAFIRQWLGEALDEMGADMPHHLAFWHYMAASLQLFQSENLSREEYIEDYFRIIGYLEQAIENSDDAAVIAHLQGSSEGITDMFFRSGAGDCETISAFYAERVAANTDDLEFLNEVLSTLSRLGCRDSELAVIVAGHIHVIAPTAQSALIMAHRALNNSDNAAALRYLRQAAELEDDNTRASAIMTQIAGILLYQRNLAGARTAAQEALRFNPSNGAAQMLIGQAFASGASGVVSADRVGLVFSAAIDQLERAIAIDPSVAPQARNLINQYTRHLLDSETAFMMGIRAGEQVHIPGWINVTTTVRLR